MKVWGAWGSAWVTALHCSDNSSRLNAAMMSGLGSHPSDKPAWQGRQFGGRSCLCKKMLFWFHTFSYVLLGLWVLSCRGTSRSAAEVQGPGELPAQGLGCGGWQEQEVPPHRPPIQGLLRQQVGNQGGSTVGQQLAKRWVVASTTVLALLLWQQLAMRRRHGMHVCVLCGSAYCRCTAVWFASTVGGLCDSESRRLHT